MKSFKCIVVLFLVLLFAFPVTAGKRPNRKPVIGLTDPKSPNYVLLPYPENREEIIADLMHYAEHRGGYDKAFWRYDSTTRRIPPKQKIYQNLVSPNPDYEVGKIIKVKNRNDRMLDDYHWIILVMDRDGRIAMRCTMSASGIMYRSLPIPRERFEKLPPKLLKRFLRRLKPLTEKLVKDILSESLGYTVEDREIITMERVAYSGGRIGSRLYPVWEIIMTGPRLYYYSDNMDMLYSVEKVFPWKKIRGRSRKSKSSMVSHRDYLRDTLNDRFIILKKIPRIK